MHEDRLDEEWQTALQHAQEEECLETLGLLRPLRALPTLQAARSVAPRTSIRTALHIMQQDRLSCLLVVEQERLLGVFTEHDVLTRVAMQAVDLDWTPVRAYMTPNPECLELDDELVYALQRMSLDHCRHIPVLDEQGRPTALVSMQAIVADLVARFPAEILNLPPVPAHRRPRTQDGA